MRLVLLVLILLAVAIPSFAAPPDERNQSDGGPYGRPAADYRCFEVMVDVAKDGQKLAGIVCVKIPKGQLAPSKDDTPKDTPADR